MHVCPQNIKHQRPLRSSQSWQPRNGTRAQSRGIVEVPASATFPAREGCGGCIPEWLIIAPWPIFCNTSTFHLSTQCPVLMYIATFYSTGTNHLPQTIFYGLHLLLCTVCMPSEYFSPSNRKDTSIGNSDYWPTTNQNSIPHTDNTLLHSPVYKPALGFKQPLRQLVPRILYRRGKSGIGVKLWPLTSSSSFEVMKAWRYGSTSSYILTAWCFIKQTGLAS